jgi:hypothetical protein
MRWPSACEDISLGVGEDITKQSSGDCGLRTEVLCDSDI